MWFEYLRLISECRPKIVLIENVAVLKSRGLDVVVNGLASINYFCWWDCVPALAVGAPHLRDRIWVTAVPYETMPELEGEQFKEIRTKFPRAGASTARGLIEMKPQATIKMCKEAMGAVKREDGVTWLTAIDQPLFPTPSSSSSSSSSSSYGSNRGGAAGRVGPIRHSLASMAKSGEWPDEIPCFPTPTVGDSRNSRNSRNSTAGRTPGGNHHAGTTLSDFMRLWPSSSRDWKDTGEGRMGRGQLPEAVRAESRIWPTPRASANELRTTKSAPSHGTTHGQVLSGVVCDAEREAGREVAEPSQSAGSLNPYWVEWLMKIPVGWTDLSCDHPIQYDNLSEYGIPRTAKDIEDRKDRLMAIGNSLCWPVAYTRIEQAHRLLGISIEPAEDAA